MDRMNTRADVVEFAKQAAARAYPDASEEVALGRFATTEQGRRLRELMAELPDDPPEEVQKAEPNHTAAYRTLECEAGELRKLHPEMTFERALATAKEQNPQAAAEHRDEMRRRVASR